MDRVKQHRQLARQIVEKIATTGQNLHKEVINHVITDEEHGHYLMFNDGWLKDYRRIYGCVIHIEVKDNGKVYLHYDGTDMEVGQQLLDGGVLPQELVPAFNHPIVREDMGFAVA